MVFEGDFFLITDLVTESLEPSRSRVTARIGLDPSHPVYKGHFPGNPVVPGVCQIQIIREILQKSTGRKLFIGRCDQIKFLSMITPSLATPLDLEILVKGSEDHGLSVTASILREGTPCMKFKGTLYSR